MGLFAKCTGYLQSTYRDGTNVLLQSKIQTGDNDYSALNCFAPGIEINPASGEFLVVSKINNSNSFMVTLGGVNQNITPVCSQGERRIYSTDTTGSTVMSQVYLTNTGTIAIKNTVYSLKTLLDDLITILSSLTTYGAPPSHTISPATVTQLTAWQVKLDALLEA